MAAANSSKKQTGPPQLPSCGRTRNELDDLLARIKKDELEMSYFFFQGEPPEHLKHFTIEDKLLRCIECGKTISGHPRENAIADDAERKRPRSDLPFEATSLLAPWYTLPMEPLLLELVETDVTKAPWTMYPREKTLFVRQEYAKVWDWVEEKGIHLLIGSPGIGKTWCLDYLLLRALQPGAPYDAIVTLTEGQANVIIVSDDGVTSRTMYGQIEREYPDNKFLSTIEGAQAKNVLLLHDVKSAKGKVEFPLRLRFINSLMQKILAVTVVVATSTNRANYGVFEKSYISQIRKYFIPCWTYEEMMRFPLQLSCGKEEEAEQREELFRKFGGVPRSWVNPENALAHQEDDAATIDVFRVSPLTPSSLTMMIPSEDRKKAATWTFVSRGAEEVWMKKKGLKTDLDVLRSLEEGGIVTGDVRGRFFEGHVKSLLKSGMGHVFSLTDLSTGLSNEQFSVPKGASVAHFSGSSASAVAPGKVPTLWIPRNSNFPFVDFIFVEPNGDTTLLQVTVASSHNPSRKVVEELLTNLQTKGVTSIVPVSCVVKRLIWVVDAANKCNVTQLVKDGTATQPEKGKKKHNPKGKASAKKQYEKIPQFQAVVPKDPPISRDVISRTVARHQLFYCGLSA